jgi:hypothetical protein
MGIVQKEVVVAYFEIFYPLSHARTGQNYDNPLSQQTLPKTNSKRKKDRRVTADLSCAVSSYIRTISRLLGTCLFHILIQVLSMQNQDSMNQAHLESPQCSKLTQATRVVLSSDEKMAVMCR